MIAPAILALAVVVQGPPPQKIPLYVYEEYDRIPDKTTMTLDLGPIVDEPPTPLRLRIACTFEGNARRPGVAPVVLFFDSASREWRYVNNRGLAVLADASRVNKTVSYRAQVGRGRVSEHLAADLTADEFRSIAVARSVEGKVGPIEFKLSEPQRAALAEFLSYIDNPSVDANKRRVEAVRLAELQQAAEAKRIADAQMAKTASDTEASETLLQEARALDRASKTVKALELYRKIVSLYPDTSAAKQAGARVKAMTKARR